MVQAYKNLDFRRLLRGRLDGIEPQFANRVVGLADLGADLVIEFIDRRDARVQKLLNNKIDRYSDYDRPSFEFRLSERFTLVDRKDLSGGNRTIYFAVNRQAAVR